MESSQQAEQAIQALLKNSSLVGEDFFRSVVHELAALLQAKYTFVGQLTAPGHLQMVAWCVDGQMADNVDFDMGAIPEEAILSPGIQFYPQDLQQIFPHVALLKELGVQSYMGIPFFASTGALLGLVGILHDAPMPESDLAGQMLTIFAARASLELERLQAEESLRQNEQKFRGFVEQSSDGMALLDEKGVIVEWNHANEQITGLARDQVVGHSLPEVRRWLSGSNTASDDADRQMYQIIFRSSQTGESMFENAPIDVMYQRADGTRRIVQQTSFPIQTGQGYLYGVVTRDVTQRRQAETIRQSNERHLTLLNDITQMALEAPDLAGMLQTLADRLGELIYADDCFISLWDDEQKIAIPAAASGRLHEPYVNLQIEPGEVTLTAAVLQAGRSILVDDVTHSPYNSMRINVLFPMHSVLGVPLKAGDRKLGAVIFAFQHFHEFTTDDVARCEQACRLSALAIAKNQFIEEAGRRTTELETLFKISRVMRTARNRAEIPAVVLDQILALFEVEGAALEIYDPANHETVVELGRGCWASWTGKHLPAKEGVSAQIIASSQPCILNEIQNNFHFFNAESKGRVQCAAGVPLVSQERVLGILWVGGQQPITEKQMRLFTAISDAIANALHRQALHESLQTQLEALRMTQARLVQSEKLAAIGELIAGVAHELNNPLTSVLLYAQLIQQQTIPLQVGDDMSRLITETRRAANTVRGLLDFARQRPAERKLTQLNDILLTTLDLLAYELRAHDIRCETRLAPDLPLTMIDPHQLQQVFINLINNAWQAMHTAHNQGHLIVNTEVGRSLFWEGKNLREPMIRIRIMDDGPGILPDVLSRIFDPFFTTKPEGVGTGLGLSICHGIVTEHGGHIWVESQPGEGATFFIELPVVTTRAADKEESTPPKDETALTPSSSLPVTAGRILLIDDEPNVLEVLSRVLKRKGYKVDTANNGTAGLACLFKSQYDLILSDIRMPELNGPEFYNQVAAKDPHMAARIIFTTGDTVNAATRRFLEDTSVPYLTKPFEIQDLINRVRQVMAYP